MRKETLSLKLINNKFTIVEKKNTLINFSSFFTKVNSWYRRFVMNIDIQNSLVKEKHIV